ncbi:MAG: hypothetical protein HOQ11_05470 [Gemmatimonadaceae bacterium]|nr:hypothetical protein [Gemmatimonadaceae bacterium]
MPRPAHSLAAAAALCAVACSDSSSPTPPKKDLTQVTSRYTAELNVRGSYGYTSTWGTRSNPDGTSVRGNAVFIWNVAGAAPTIVDSLIVPSYPGLAGVTTTGDVQVTDDGTLLGVATERFGGQLVLYSLADPAHPALLSQFHSADTDPGVHTAELARVNGKLYAFLSIDPASGFPARLVVLDLCEPALPVQGLARVMGNPFVHDVFVRDSLLFTALWNDGLSIWDIGGSRGGTPANPVFISNVRTFGGEVHNVWWFHDASSGAKKYVFVGQEGPANLFTTTSGDIHVVDISDITAPVEVAYYTVPGAGTHNFSVDESGGTLYAAYYNGGVRAIDVRGDLSTCAAAARGINNLCELRAAGRERAHYLDSGGRFIWGVQRVGDRVFASDMLHGLVAIDVSSLHR